MDKIQAFLITSNRKDLAQEYFEKIAIDDEFLNEDEWRQIVELIKKGGGGSADESLEQAKFIKSYENAKKIFKKRILINFAINEIPNQQKVTNFSNSTLEYLHEAGSHYSLRLRKKLEKTTITPEIYKTKSYNELIESGFKDISTDRKLKNGSVTLEFCGLPGKGFNIFQLNSSGKLTTDTYKMPPVLKTWVGLKTREDWDIAWSWLKNYLIQRDDKTIKSKENKEQKKLEWENLKKEMHVEEDFLNDEDIDRIDDFVFKIRGEHWKDNWQIKKIRATVLESIGLKTSRPISSYWIYSRKNKEKSNYKKRINKYFDIMGVNEDDKYDPSSSYFRVTLKPTIVFEEFLQNRKAKLNYNYDVIVSLAE